MDEPRALTGQQPEAIKVLLIEDNPGDARLIREILARARGAQFELERVERLSTALERLAAGRFQAILLDLTLPDSSGLDTFLQVHARAPHVPITVLSGFDDEVVAIRAVREGAQDYLVKGEGGGSLLVRTIRYAIERQRAEEALKQSEEIFRSMIEHALDIITVLDGDGTIRYESPSVERVLGYQPRELQGQPLAPFVHPEDRGAIEELFAGRSSPRAFEFRFRHKDGSWRTLEAVGQNLTGQPPLSGVIINSRDVTARKRSEEQLRHANETLRAVIGTSPVAIYTLDERGCVESWNAAARRIFGWTEEEVLGKPLPTVPGPERETFRDNVGRVLAGENFQGLEVKRVRKDGTPVEVAIWTTLLDDGAGRSRIMAVVADVTERKRLEEQLRQSQRIEAVGRLAGGVAHDFNNLLTIISGYSDILLASAEVDGPQRRNVEEIRNAAARAAALTSQLLAFSRRQVLQPKVIGLNEVVSDLNKMLRRLIREDIELRTELDPLLGAVKADPGQIGQVLLNLVVNAREAMPSGGVLTIRTANADFPEDYVGPEGSIAAGAYVSLTVSDTGHGMDAAVREHVFEPFFTTKPHGKGTGLGLSTVHGIVKQSGGEIWVDSEPGRGTSFRIFLPRLDQPLDTHAPPPLPPPLRQGAETVLVAEDEQTLRQLVCDILSARGYRVLGARNGAEALDLAGRFKGRIHLLLTDLVMPRLGGRELAGRLAAERPGIKIVFMSGYTDEANSVPGTPGRFLQKPFTAEMLLRQIRQALDE